jgi:dolichol-phosphate mannosyltransferase
VYNEEAGVKQFIDDMLRPALAATKHKYEIIFVNDGSRDESLEILSEIAAEDKQTKVINFSRNFGKEAALTAGIRAATGDAVITIDADGQQDPAFIGEMVEKWGRGADIVAAVRKDYEKHGIIAKAGSALFYKLLRILGVRTLVPGSLDFRLMDRQVVDEFNTLTERGRITRGLIDWMGYKQETIYVKYGARLAGKPSYNFKKLFGLAVDSFISLSTTPLVIFGYVGAFITLASGLLGLFVIVEMPILGDPLHLNWTGPTMLAIFITFLVGLVLISQAITALYVSHIHAESQNRPLYIIDWKRSCNLKHD